MIKYQYQILRYTHDQFTQEFGNIGIVLFAPEKGFLSCKVINRFARLSNFFGEINGHFLISSLNHFEKKILEITESNSIGQFQNEKKDTTSLEAITSFILPKDDSALFLTEVNYGIDIDPSIALEELYERIVEKYNSEGNADKHTDYYAWRKAYKEYFDKYDITSKLEKHTIETKKDRIAFDKAWKNGTWHCYQSLAFDLKREDSIKNKVYKWSGIIKELETAKEELNLYFLTTSPLHEHSDLKEFITETLSLKGRSIKVTVVEESQAEQFAVEVRDKMAKSSVI